MKKLKKMNQFRFYSIILTISFFCIFISQPSFSESVDINLDIDPISQTVYVGDNVQFDIYLSGTQDIWNDWALFDLRLFFIYDPTVINYKDFVMGDWANYWEGDSSANIDVGSPFYEIGITIGSYIPDDEGRLAENYSGLFATINFTAISPGVSPFRNSGSGRGGTSYPEGDPRNSYYLSFNSAPSGSTVTVLDSNPVPEPTTMLLLGLGLIGIAGVRRKMQR